MARKRKRDEYGNWILDNDPSERDSQQRITDQSESMPLDWRDYIALAIASLETFLLPFVIFILVMLGIVLALAFFR